MVIQALTLIDLGVTRQLTVYPCVSLAKLGSL